MTTANKAEVEKAKEGPEKEKEKDKETEKDKEPEKEAIEPEPEKPSKDNTAVDESLAPNAAAEETTKPKAMRRGALNKAGAAEETKKKDIRLDLDNLGLG